MYSKRITNTAPTGIFVDFNWHPITCSTRQSIFKFHNGDCSYCYRWGISSAPQIHAAWIEVYYVVRDLVYHWGVHLGARNMHANINGLSSGTHWKIQCNAKPRGWDRLRRLSKNVMIWMGSAWNSTHSFYDVLKAREYFPLRYLQSEKETKNCKL